MEPNSTTGGIIRESKRIGEDSVVSAKGHYEAGARWGWAHLAIGLPSALVSGVAGVTALSHFPMLGGILALVGGTLTGATTFLNPERRAAAHRSAGDGYIGLRNKARLLREVKVPNASDADQLVTELEELSQAYDDHTQGSPQLPTWAYKKAEKGIRAGEAEHAVDRESKGRERS